MKKIIPLLNRVLIARSKAETVKGRILLPETAKEKPKQGVVQATGPGKRDEQGKIEPISVKVGDTVLFSNYAGTAVESDGKEELLLISEEDILGVIG